MHRAIARLEKCQYGAAYRNKKLFTFDVPQGLLNRSLMGQRSNKDAFVDTVADLQCLDLFGKRLCEFIVNAILHKNPIRRHASLPGVAELGEDAGFNSSLDLCIVKDDERTVAT